MFERIFEECRRHNLKLEIGCNELDEVYIQVSRENKEFPDMHKRAIIDPDLYLNGNLDIRMAEIINFLIREVSH